MSLLVQSLLVSLIVWLGFMDRSFLHTFFYRPIVIGPVVGLVFNNLSMGLQVGVAVELMFLAIVFVGTATPPDETLSAGLAAAFACLSNNAEIGIATALPIALIGQMGRQTRFSIFEWTGINFRKAASNGDKRGIILWTSVIPSIINYVLFGIPVFIAVYLGAEYVQAIIDFIPNWLIEGISTGGGLIGAVGVALLMSQVGDKKLWPYFATGFFLAAYLGINMIGIALVAAIIIALHYYSDKKKEGPLSEKVEKTESAVKYETLSRKDLWSTFKYSLAIESGCPGSIQEAPGFCQGMIPVIEKRYETQEEKAEAYERHTQYFLTEGRMAATCIGVATAMEERNAIVGDIEPTSINAIKAALMGPLAGIGDSLLHGTLRPIMAGIAISMITASNHTSALGTLLFLVVMGGVGMTMRYIGIFKGYEKGIDLVSNLKEGGMLDLFTKYAGIAGFLVSGGFISSLVRLNLSYSYTAGETVIKLQEVLDGLMPSLIPLLFTLLVYWLINKKKVNIILMMFGIIFLGIVLVLLGVV